MKKIESQRDWGDYINPNVYALGTALFSIQDLFTFEPGKVTIHRGAMERLIAVMDDYSSNEIAYPYFTADDAGEFE